MHRFFVPAGFASDTVELTGPEAHHLLHVLRLGVGDDVELFDGRGVQAAGRVETTTRQTVGMRLISRSASPRATTRSLILATAMPKGDRFGWLVEKATELGVQRLIPLIIRSLSLPIARGMFTLLSTEHGLTDALAIPPIVLAGRVPPKLEPVLCVARKTVIHTDT